MSKPNPDIDHLINDASFLRWIDGNASEAERDRWSDWLSNDHERHTIVNEVKQVIKSLKFKKSHGLDIESELNRLNASIESYSRINRLHSLQSSRNTFKGIYPKVAAAVLILISISVVFKFAQDGFFDPVEVQTLVDEYTITSTGKGELKLITMSDGSRITLNANSQLRFPSHIKDRNVEMWLEGEAYFQVSRLEGEQERTFKVHVEGGDISVLGTTFNVNAYSERSEVYLSEGTVKIDLKNTGDSIRDTHVMKPGELSVLSPTSSRIKTRLADGAFYTAWKDNKLVFDRTPLEDISERLGYIYDVEFVFEQDRYKHLLISGSLPNNNLSVFIKALEEIVQQKVTLQDETIFIGE